MAQAALTNGNLRYTRRGGSGFTVFVFGGMPIAFAQQISNQSPSFVSQPSVIQPMDEPYPVEILTPVAAGVGTMVLSLYDLWARTPNDITKVWDRLGLNGSAPGSTSYTIPGAVPTNPGSSQGYGSLGGNAGIFTSASDIVDIAIQQAQATPSQMRIVEYIRQIPNMGNGVVNGQATTTGANVGYVMYHGCTIVDVRDDETVNVGTLEIIKTITVNYTYSTRSNPSAGTNFALKLRQGA